MFMRGYSIGCLVGGMDREGVLVEIDGRIKRLNAQIEIAEERLRYLEEVGAPSKYRILRSRRDYRVYYLILMGLWLIAGVLLLMHLKKSLPASFNIPLLPYLLMALVIAVVPAVYLLMSKGKTPGTPMDELGELERAAHIVISGFYIPLRRAVEMGDPEGMKGLAEKLLNDPILSRAVKMMHEGDPKMMAYALYLYTVYNERLRDEVEDALAALTNRPLRALLLTLLPPNGAGGERAKAGE